MVPISSSFSVILTTRNDALRKQGILPPKAPDPNDQFEEALQQAVQEAEANRLENLNLDELAELEDDEDDAFLESYRFDTPHPTEHKLMVDKSGCTKFENSNTRVFSVVWNRSRNQTL